MNASDVTRVLDSRYRIDAIGCRELTASPDRDRAVFSVAAADGRWWTVKAYRTGAIPDRLAGCGVRTAAAYLETRARTLAFLERRGYPAPRVQTTSDGSFVARSAGWSILVTTFLEGVTPDPTPKTLRDIGALLGRLHAMRPSRARAAVGFSQWSASGIRAARSRLELASDPLPRPWQRTCREYCDVLQLFSHVVRLPIRIVHTDGWLGNVVRGRRGSLALIDWDGGGLGPAVLDLGRLLLAVEWKASGPPRTVRPNAQLIGAALEGYCQRRMPTRLERRVLPDALRFAVVFFASNQLTRLRHERWSDRLERSLTYVDVWYRACDEIGTIARRWLDAYSPKRSRSMPSASATSAVVARHAGSR